MDSKEYKVNQITILTGQAPSYDIKSQKQETDVINLQGVFSAAQVILSPGIIKYIDTDLSSQAIEIPSLKMQMEEGLPNDRSTISFTLAIRSLEGQILNKVTKTNKQKFKEGSETNQTMGLQLALKNMKYGEKAVFKISPDLQQSISESNIKQQANIKVIKFVTETQSQQDQLREQDQIYILHYQDYTNEKKEANQYNFEERINKMDYLRGMATTNFKSANYGDALRAYKQILPYCSQIPKVIKATWNEQQINSLLNELKKTYINMARCSMKMARCSIKMEEWIESKKFIQLALAIEPMNNIANFILGRCYFECKNYLDAKETFEKLLTSDIDEEQRQDIQIYLNRMKIKVDEKKIKVDDLQEKKIAKHIISKIGEEDPQEILRIRKNKYEQIEKARLKNELVRKIQSGDIYDQDELMKL